MTARNVSRLDSDPLLLPVTSRQVQAQANPLALERSVVIIGLILATAEARSLACLMIMHLLSNVAVSGVLQEDPCVAFRVKLESALPIPKRSQFHLRKTKHLHRAGAQPTEPEKTFLCMDLSRQTRTQNQ